MAETTPVAPPRETRPRQHQRRRERVFYMRHFDEIIGLAVARYGGPDAFERILAETRPPKPHDIAAIPDDRVLAAMARRVFCAGFSSKVINAKGRKQKFPAKGKAGSQLSLVAGVRNRLDLLLSA